MDLTTLAILLVAGTVGGAINAVAGGATFFTFPALLGIGLPPVTANASNAVALWPGHAAAVPAYRREIAKARHGLVWRGLVALAGGAIGAQLLLATGDRLFEALIPWLLLAATLLFAFGPRLSRIVGSAEARKAGRGLVLGLAVEFAFAVYGGYFGAGLGVLLMACLSLLGHDDLHEANALKNLLATLVTAASVGSFVLAGVIAWPETLVMIGGAIFGGYFGARAARSVGPGVLRAVIIAVGLMMSGYYFVTVSV